MFQWKNTRSSSPISMLQMVILLRRRTFEAVLLFQDMDRSPPRVLGDLPGFRFEVGSFGFRLIVVILTSHDEIFVHWILLRHISNYKRVNLEEMSDFDYVLKA